MGPDTTQRSPKRRRWLLIFLAGLVTVACVSVTLLSISAVQAWIVCRAVSLQPGWRVEFHRFDAGPTGVDVEGLKFAMPGIDAESAPIVVRIAPGRLFNKRELKFERVEARKLRVTLTPAQFAASSSREPFNGLCPLLQLPLAWALDTAEIDGEIAVRDGGQSVVVGSFTVKGGGLSSEQPGEFSYQLEINSAYLPAAQENRIRSSGTVRLTQGQEHRIAALTIEGDLHLPRYGNLALPPAKFVLSAKAAEKGEIYHARLDLGKSGSLEFDGTLNGALKKLTGRAVAHVEQSLIAAITEEKIPTAVADATADLTLDLRSNDLDVTLGGKLLAHDWTKLDPRLSAVEPLQGQLIAALSRRGGKLSLRTLDATLRAENSPAIIRCKLAQPIDPAALPSTPLATLTVDHLPVTWANPFLTPARLSVDPAEVFAAWNVSVSPDRNTLSLIPALPVTLLDATLKGSELPPLPAFSFSFSPHFSLSRTQATLSIDDIVITTPQSDNLSLTLKASFDFAAAQLQTSGELSGAIPTLLSGAEQPLPFTFHARWDASLTRSNLKLKILELATHRDGTAPCLALQLLQPLALDLANLTTPATTTTTELARLKFEGLPVGWVSRWIAPREITGTIGAGESILRAAPDGRLTLESATPWRLVNATAGIGGKAFFVGEATVTPSLAVHADRCTAELRDIYASHQDGSRIQGNITADVRIKDRKASTSIELYVDLPALPHSEKTFGPLYAALRAKSHNETPTIAIVDELWFRLLSRDREVVLLEATTPFAAGLSNSGLITAKTDSPLKLTTGEFPLAWLRPWLPALEADGILQPGEFHLTADLTKFRLRPIKPVHVRNFAARVAGRDIARDMDFSFHPGVDLTLICIPTPTFQLAYTGAGHLTNGAIDVAGQRAVDLDLSVSFVGDDKRIYPSGLDYTTRADFTQLSRVPALAGTGLPARGTFVARANGDLLGRSPLELWSRIEGIPSADGTRTLAPLEILAHGKFSPAQQSLDADVKLNLETQPRATDAHFEAKLNVGAGRLETASSFHSQFFDAAEAFAFVDAVQKSRIATKPSAAGTTPSASSPESIPQASLSQSEPLWSRLRGDFDLDLGTVRFAPYQIDRVRGRLSVRDRELVLHELDGEMFSGRWHGDARLDYRPEHSAADHTLSAGFKIEQFDSARIVQTVFPTELSSVDARIDVRSSVYSEGNALVQLIDRAGVEFTAEGRQGLVRLNVPQQEKTATMAVFGGTLLLSPELRALGRLLKKFAEMPVDELRITGERQEDGDVLLTEFRLDSPQARLFAQGKIPNIPGSPLMDRPLELSVDLAAKDEMAVILGGMSLIEKNPRADGYRPLKEKFELRGKAGEPDTRPLYDLLAKAVLGSKGTWGFLMRKVQDQVNKMKTTDPKRPASQ